MIEVTKAAKSKIARLLKDQHPDVALRLEISAGGCNGFSYKFDLSEAVPDDITVKWDGGCLVIDRISAEVVGSVQVDFIDNLSGSYFVAEIAEATSQCGCGHSFSI